MPTCGVGFPFVVGCGGKLLSFCWGWFFTQPTLLVNGNTANKANAADCQSKVFLVSDVARHGDSSFDNVCWQTTDSRRDVLCRVESYGIGYLCSALIGGVGWIGRFY